MDAITRQNYLSELEKKNESSSSSEKNEDNEFRLEDRKLEQLDLVRKKSSDRHVYSTPPISESQSKKSRAVDDNLFGPFSATQPNRALFSPHDPDSIVASTSTPRTKRGSKFSPSPRAGLVGEREKRRRTEEGISKESSPNPSLSSPGSETPHQGGEYSSLTFNITVSAAAASNDPSLLPATEVSKLNESTISSSSPALGSSPTNFLQELDESSSHGSTTPAPLPPRRVQTRPRSLTAEELPAPALSIQTGLSLTTSSSGNALSTTAAGGDAKPIPSSAVESIEGSTPPVSGKDDSGSSSPIPFTERLSSTSLISPSSFDGNLDTGGEAAEAADLDESFLLEEERLRFLLAGDEISFHYNCHRIDGMEEIRSIICLCKYSLVLIDGYELAPDGEMIKLHGANVDSAAVVHTSIYEESGTTGQMMSVAESLGEEEEQVRRWSYSDITEIAKRRFLLRQAALELFFVDGSNYLLVVNVAQREAIYNNLIELCPSLTNKSKASNLFTSGDTTAATLQVMTKAWERGDLSNFDYLQSLNSLAGRTYNDYNQYPVFPWILRDYESNVLRLHDPAIYRDLSRPMGAITESRANGVVKKWNESKSAVDQPYHHGSHYSSFGVVLYYMLRCEPFTQRFISFQSGRFDLPDRLFFSIKQSWLSASTHESNTDVKELIPEFFYYSEFLHNGNNLNLGVRQDRQVVNDVILPTWCHGSAREFVRLHRAALESEFISAHLHDWIDLIFGYKQQGEAAVKALNVFFYLTYAGEVDIDRIQDEKMKKATIAQIKSFGQTPTRILSTPHPPRKLMGQTGNLFKNQLLNLFKAIDPALYTHPIGGIMPLEDGGEGDRGILVVRPGMLILPPTSDLSRSTLAGTASRIFTLKKPSHKKTLTGARVRLFYFLAWGFADSTLRVGYVEPNSSAGGIMSPATIKYNRVYAGMHDSKGIGVVAAPEVDIGLIVTAGVEDANGCIWRRDIRDDSSIYTLAGRLVGHSRPITCIAITRAYSLIATGSYDSTVILWDLYRHIAIRQLRIVERGSIIRHLAFNNLTGMLVFASAYPNCLSVVDVNGVLITQYPALRYRTMDQALTPNKITPAAVAASVKNPNGNVASLQLPAATPAAKVIKPNRMTGGLVLPKVAPTAAAAGGHNRTTTSFVSPTSSSAAAPPSPHNRTHSAQASTSNKAIFHALGGHNRSTSNTNPSLPFNDQISSLCVLDSAGYQLTNTCIVICTGHITGKIRIWHATYELAPASPLPPSPHDALAQQKPSPPSPSPPSVAVADTSVTAPRPSFGHSQSTIGERKTSGDDKTSARDNFVRPRSNPHLTRETSGNAVAPIFTSTDSSTNSTDNTPSSISSSSHSILMASPLSPNELAPDNPPLTVRNLSVPLMKAESNETERKEEKETADDGNNTTSPEGEDKLKNTTFSPLTSPTSAVGNVSPPFSPVSSGSTVSVSSSGSGEGGGDEDATTLTAAEEKSNAITVLTMASATTAPHTGPTNATPTTTINLPVPASISASTSLAKPAAAASAGTTLIRLWRLHVVSEWSHNSAPVISLYPSSDSSSLYSGDTHGYVHHWKVPLGLESNSIEGACQCKPSAALKERERRKQTGRRLCLANPRNCTAIVCDYCVLEHLRTVHPPVVHGQTNRRR